MPRKIAEYSLQVRKDGQERRFRQLPKVVVPYGFGPMLVISVDGGPRTTLVQHVRLFEAEDGSLFEELEVRTVKVNCGERFICPEPHGVGWTVHDDESENFTVYRRPMPGGERPTFADASAAAPKGGV